ncbi:beta-glucosidase family protein [Rhodanobacter hydrolyticus]|uniref:Glycoside hydrolase family 3 C-terminal domain-containing protein n=1 Tax=Rhodanobacter hydrolyticus TaxID=2250595 RepID=A0ABW8JA60_9GAMM
MTVHHLRRSLLRCGVGALVLAWLPMPSLAQAAQPTDADARAERIVQKMPPEALHGLVQSYFMGGTAKQPPGSIGAAGYVPALPAYGIPAQQQNDAGIGPNNYPVGFDARGWPTGVRGNAGDATPLPSTLALAATWNPRLAETGGRMIADEARAQGINVLLAGGINLSREPRNGRTFEYFGEDPLLAGTMDGAEIRGIQSRHVVSTIKHFALNAQETNRLAISSDIGERAMRESDLLAFELAIEQGHPGAVMCGYNKVNGIYDCSNAHLLNDVLKRDWHYPGWVMTDWGGDHGVTDALAGVDQVSGEDFTGDDNGKGNFGAPLMRAIADHTIPVSRLQDMARRILRSMLANGLFDAPPPKPVDFEADAKVSQDAEEQALVLLKNDAAQLPLDAHVQRIAVIGGHADVGVLSGGGSAQVWPVHGPAIKPVHPDLHDSASPWIVYDPSSPLRALQQRFRKARIDYVDGDDPARATALAKSADVAIVFATQWEAEGIDLPNLSLPGHQDALVTAVAAANPHTVVVLESGTAVRMPWLPNVAAVLEAWYPGARGGEAIADVLSGRVNPSGRLPITFPRDERQLPRPVIAGGASADYDVEGAAVGYKWFDRQKLEPLFPFGYGLSYTRFVYSDLKVSTGPRVTVSFVVRNMGSRAGMDTPQVYVDMPTADGEAPRRLAGFDKVDLKPGEQAVVSATIDPRLFAVFDVAANRWRIDAGRYTVEVGHSSRDLALCGTTDMKAASIAP